MSLLVAVLLPMPKEANTRYPILAADQKEAKKHASKLSYKKINPLHVDFDTLNSPFAVRDVYSRASQLGYIAVHRDRGTSGAGVRVDVSVSSAGSVRLPSVWPVPRCRADVWWPALPSAVSAFHWSRVPSPRSRDRGGVQRFQRRASVCHCY
ncbi:hypothetical protein C7M84_001381 [Penaeus vannamei]|uniref:Uncharacterized protein n=1 Tax=Penaeus vannamei TaxID=6689 RepID=A0A3R7PR01_PENVA|nr:hypothetical protein C7M84_001381 [Penaeus vannamei]